MKNVSEFFGCKVFDDRVMKANLSAKIYQSLRKTTGRLPMELLIIPIGFSHLPG